jgi:O-antigen/teichoic acid export membrane protein
MVGNFLFSLTVRGLGVLLGFLVTYFVAKGLSLDDSGFFFLMIALVTAFSAFSRLGFDYYTVKVLSVFKKNSEYSLITNYVVGVFYRIFASSLFFLFFLFLLFPLFGLDDNYYFIYQIFLIAIIPFSLFSFLGFVFQSVGKVNLFLISQGAGVSFFFLLLLYLISLTGDFSLEKTVYSYVCSCFMLLFFFLSLYFVSYPFTIKSSFRSSKEIFPFRGGDNNVLGIFIGQLFIQCCSKVKRFIG